MSEVALLQVTTVHPRGDTRILHRQVLTLARHGEWPVALMVADGIGSGRVEVAGTGVQILDLGRSSWGGRIGRFLFGTWRVLHRARKSGARAVHFHDPELIPAGILLKLMGRKIVYDVHEDVPLQILQKHWLPRSLRGLVAWSMQRLELLGARVFDGIVAATPTIALRFPPEKTIVVQNFPEPSELETPGGTPYPQRENAFVYIGAISSIRGAREMIEAMDRLDVADARLHLAGRYVPETLGAELEALTGWSRVKYHGWLSRPQIANVIGQARAGLVVLHPTRNYLDAYPIKMFEYMAAGLPVIASDFPLWRSIVGEAKCGLLVDPMDAEAISRAMQWLLENPKEAEAMGRRGALAVQTKFNWSREATKLLEFYGGLMRQP